MAGPGRSGWLMANDAHQLLVNPAVTCRRGPARASPTSPGVLRPAWRRAAVAQGTEYWWMVEWMLPRPAQPSEVPSSTYDGVADLWCTCCTEAAAQVVCSSRRSTDYLLLFIITWCRAWPITTWFLPLWAPWCLARLRYYAINNSDIMWRRA